MKNRKNIWLGLAGLSGLLFLSLLYPLEEDIFENNYATILEDNNKNLLGARIASDGQWRFPEVQSIPSKIEFATLAFEDQYFYWHPGVNPVALFRALYLNIDAGRIVSGGSTISMQVARMAMGNRPRTLLQKLNEVWFAARLELQLSKKEILQLYISHAPYGGNVVGLSAASWRYYGRSADKLSWAEAANLAVLPNSPASIFPGKNDSTLLRKRNRLLLKLYEDGLLDASEYSLSLLEPIPGKPMRLPNISPHLLDRAIRDGFKGKVIRTTIDRQLQSEVQHMVEQYHVGLSSKQIHNAAVIIVEIETGKVLSYIGNAGNDRRHDPEVDIISSKRSPGSLLKPILYSLAIDEGCITPRQLLPDIPIYYKGFTPKNFDKKFSGAVHANEALRSSLNVPFVYLLKAYGYEKFYDKLQKMGLSSLNKDPGHYGLTLVLGGGEVTMWDLAALYAGLVRAAQGGDRHGNFWSENTYIEGVPGYANINQIELDAAAAWHTLKAMQELRRPDQESHWQRFGNARPIAWKTGTSYGHKDAWAIGANSKYVVATWAGNADGEGRPDLVGVTVAAPLMFKVFNLLAGDADFPMPRGKTTLESICLKSGMKAGRYCTEISTDFISKKIKRTAICPYHQLVHLDKEGKYMVNSACYPVSKMLKSSWFILPPAQAWYYQKYNIDYFKLPELAPDCASGVASMEMIYPREDTKVFVPIELDKEEGRVVFEAAHQNFAAKIYWHLDDKFVGVTSGDHHIGMYPTKGNHKLSLVDENGEELIVEFEVLNDAK